MFNEETLNRFATELQRKKAEKESKDYQDILKFVKRTADHFCDFSDLAWFASTRSPSLPTTSVFLSNFDDVCKSMNAIPLLFENEYLNTAKREMRYLIETFSKYLFLDQKLSLVPVEEKTPLLDTELKLRNVDVINEIDFFFFDSRTKTNFLSSVRWFYSYTCSYVHPSHLSILENKAIINEKLFPGLPEFRRFSKEFFRLSDILVSFEPVAQIP